MNRFNKAIASLLTLVMLFTLASCDMRDVYGDDNVNSETSEGDAPTLKIAEKVNSVDVDNNNDTDTTAPDAAGVSDTKVITLAIAGDIRLSEPMIEDARAQAPEDKDYSFLRMYTGAYRALNNADIAVGAYSAIGQPYGTECDYEPPKEHIDALSALGFDVLDISGAGDGYDLLGERGIEGISSAEEGDDAIRIIESDGIKFAFLACGHEEDIAQCYSSDDFLGRVEYADFSADVLVVLVHWDENMTKDDKLPIVNDLAEHGADIIIGDGETIEDFELLTSENGSTTYVVYSTGYLMSDADEACNLCSSIVSAEFTVDGDRISGISVSAIPLFVHYSVNESGKRSDYTVYRVEDYTSELAHSHAAEVDPDGLTSYVKSVITSDYLPDALK